jgi:hypothetical protein
MTNGATGTGCPVLASVFQLNDPLIQVNVVGK